MNSDFLTMTSVDESGRADAELRNKVKSDRPELMLQVSGLSSHYGRVKALRDVDLEVRSGQLVSLVGANGAGKTTLLRTISGVQRASSGQLKFRGSDITSMAPERRVRLGICHVPEGRRIFGPLSVEDNILLGAYLRPKQEAQDSLEHMYLLFPDLKAKRHLAGGMLSGGQQQMVAMARALMGKPRLLLLDEPSMGLAPMMIEEIFCTVETLRRQGITILLVEQNAAVALQRADFGYVLETGSVILRGQGKQLMHNEQVKKAYLGH